MRTIAEVDGPFQQDSNFPDGAILDETISQAGTPVVREIYNDVLVNLYAFMRSVGIDPNGIEDSASNGYQLKQALLLLTNTLNDIEQPLILVGSVFSINIDITSLPNKYVFICNVSADYVASTSYTFKGSTATPTYSFTSPTGFKAGAEVILVLDQTGVRAYSFTASSSSVVTDIFTPFGTPLAFNNTAKVWYQSEGLLFSDLPEVYDLQGAVRVASGDGTILVYEMMIIGSYIVCLTFSPTNLHYVLYRFALSNPSAAPTVITISGTGFPTGTVTNDYQPFIYTDGTKFYITNGTGNSANGYAVNTYTMNLAAGTITSLASVSLDTSFQKTTNAIVQGIYLYTFISGTAI